MDIDGSVALVTGGASGLGLATARRLVAAGARVVVVDLPSSSGAQAAERLGPSATFAPADVTDEPRVGAALDAAVALGTLARRGELRRRRARPGGSSASAGVLPLADFANVVQVNLIGTFNVIRLAAERIARKPTRSTASAASSSTPRRSRRSTARSGRLPTPRRRAASSA